MIQHYEITREALRGAVRAYMPNDYAGIAKGTGLTVCQVRHRIRDLRADNLCHIGRWLDGVRPVWFYGPGKDAERPKAKTGTDYSNAWEARNRKTEAGDKRKAKQRANWRIREHKRKAKINPVNPFSALGL